MYNNNDLENAKHFINNISLTQYLSAYDERMEILFHFAKAFLFPFVIAVYRGTYFDKHVKLVYDHSLNLYTFHYLLTTL